MNTAHWHLLLNHLPIMGTVIGTLILIAGYVFKNNPDIKKTALGVFIFSALAAIPAYLTGEGAEEIAEKLPGVGESIIESHEDLGKLFLIFVEVIGVLSIIIFLSERFKGKATSFLYGVLLLTSIAASVFAKQVATSGGEVRHTEIRPGAGQVDSKNPDQQPNGNEKDDD